MTVNEQLPPDATATMVPLPPPLLPLLLLPLLLDPEDSVSLGSLDPLVGRTLLLLPLFDDEEDPRVPEGGTYATAPVLAGAAEGAPLAAGSAELAADAAAEGSGAADSAAEGVGGTGGVGDSGTPMLAPGAAEVVTGISIGLFGSSVAEASPPGFLSTTMVTRIGTRTAAIASTP